jgi:hypothetical protein
LISKFDRKKDKSLVVDSMGRNLTIALFYETNDGRTDIKPVWKLSDWKEAYLEIGDPTEYQAAIYLIGDWNHWKQLAEKSAVSVYIQDWRKELAVKLRSEAIAELVEQSKSPKGTTAAKWLAENGFEGKLPKVTKAQQIVEESYSDIREHSKRLGVA